MRRAGTIVLCAAAVVALFAVPGAISEQRSERFTADRWFAAGFDVLPRQLRRSLAADRATDTTLSVSGGARVAVRCRPFADDRGEHLCLALDTDGDAVALAWTTRTNGGPPGRIVYHDEDPTSEPNP